MYREVPPTGTINLFARDGDGDLGGTTTTSGLFFKMPGSVGDSPLIGAGLLCRPMARLRRQVAQASGDNGSSKEQ